MSTVKDLNKIKEKYRKKVSQNGDNSLSKNHPVILMVKFFTWIKLALFPVVVFIILGAIIIYNSDLKWSDTFMIIWLIAGGIAGVVFATYVSSKVELEDIAFRLESSGDISELTKPKENKDEKND